MHADVIQRFEAKFIPEPNSGCWLWTAATDGRGYGRFRIGSKTDGTRRSAIAPRISWSIYKGELPDDACVLHRCDNPYCVNPDHLFLGSHLDNMQDCVKKHRISRGERHSEIQKRVVARGVRHYRAGALDFFGLDNPQSKLTEDHVRAIRNDARTNFEIAREYGISFQQVSRIKRGERWGHIK
jgi:hypothetical protein